jgi:hypothetical protein
MDDGQNDSCCQQEKICLPNPLPENVFDLLSYPPFAVLPLMTHPKCRISVLYYALNPSQSKYFRQSVPLLLLYYTVSYTHFCKLYVHF